MEVHAVSFNPLPHDARGYDAFEGHVAPLASQSTPWWPKQRRARSDSPNIVVIMLDDLGFSDLSPYGSEIETPTIASIAQTGYSLTNYHVAPVCSPSRAAFLTGLNPHRAGYATVANYDPGFPGYTNELPHDVPTIAESLQASGYATFLVGKWHLTKETEMNDASSRSSWPVHHGFDRFYGYLEGLTSQFQPHRLIRDNSPVTPDEFPADYYLTDDLTNQALEMIHTLRASDRTKPFFLYLSHEAVHAPLQAKSVDIARYRGMYDHGWDVIRAERFARQISSGLFPRTTVLPELETAGVVPAQAWSSLTSEEKEIAARYMEVYAAMVDSVDQSLARIVDALRASGEYENTIIVVTSDNGGTSEGGLVGSSSYLSRFADTVGRDAVAQRDKRRDRTDIGSARSFVVHPRGWAAVSNTPFRRYKAYAHAGGIRVPLVMSWPAGLPRRGGDTGLRSQFAFISDLGLTLLDLANVDHLQSRQGWPARDVDGLSFARVLRDQHSAPTRTTQYVENNTRLAFIDGDFKIVTDHELGESVMDRVWELYDIRADPTESNNIAAANRSVVTRLADEWQLSAWRNTVFPLNDDGSLYSSRPDFYEQYSEPVRINPRAATVERYRSSRLTAFRSFHISIDATVDRNHEGVLVAHGDQGGGYVLFMENGHLCFSYNEYGEMLRVRVTGPDEPVDGVDLDFEAITGVRWNVRCYSGSREWFGECDVLQLVGMAPFTGISVGRDGGGPVDWEVHRRHGSFPFTGRLSAATYTPGPYAPYNPETIRTIMDEAQERDD
jgi:arylsulfatase